MFYVHSHLSKLCKLFSIQIQNIKQNIKRHITSNYTHKHQNHFLKVMIVFRNHIKCHMSVND